MKRLKSIVLAAFAVVIGGSAVLPAASVHAQSSAALSIVPKKNYTIEPGKSIKDTLTIRNLDGERKLELTLRAVDFTYRDDTGTPKLLLDEDAPQTAWSLKPFMKIPETVTVEPRGVKTVDMSVAMPKEYKAGSYYSAIVYSTGAPDGGNVGLSASGVTLVFASIPGPVNQNLKLEKFGAYSATSTASAEYKYFNFKKPNQMAYTLKNEGNVTESPVGSITIKHMFGKETTIDNVNPNSSVALIGQTRTYAACIKLKEQEVDFNGSRTEAKTCAEPSLWPGYYSASLNLFYGQNGNNTKEINGVGSFWYLPWWFILIVVVLLALLAAGIWFVVRKIRGTKSGKASKKKN